MGHAGERRTAWVRGGEGSVIGRHYRHTTLECGREADVGHRHQGEPPHPAAEQVQGGGDGSRALRQPVDADQDIHRPLSGTPLATSRDGDRSSLAATNASSSAIGPMGTTPASLLRSR